MAIIVVVTLLTSAFVMGLLLYILSFMIRVLRKQKSNEIKLNDTCIQNKGAACEQPYYISYKDIHQPTKNTYELQTNENSVQDMQEYVEIISGKKTLLRYFAK